ncbi:MAG: hypothetical protein IKL96_03195, partial [Kiritimatiellae bacterium]|nr:hypothetical protein [Kiritimatiellia bacterium]
CALVAAAYAAAAPLPQPDFADAGACTNIALNALSATGTLSFSLSFVLRSRRRLTARCFF